MSATRLRTLAPAGRAAMTALLLLDAALASPGGARRSGAPRPEDGGLSIRIEPVEKAVAAGADIQVRIYARNSSASAVSVPGLDSLVLADSAETGPIQRSPLRVEPEGRPGQGWTYSINEPGTPEQPSPAWSTITLEPGGERLLGEVPVIERAIDRRGVVATTHYFFLPGRPAHLRLRLENQQAVQDGVRLWTGVARSEPFEVEVRSAVVEGARFEGGFAPGRTRYALGEPIFVRFEVVNDGSAPASFPIGGDYRGSGRHDRFAFAARDETGAAVEDPVPPRAGGIGGGLGSRWTLWPGERYEERLLLNEWCRFTKAGRYVVTAKRVLNLTRADDDRLPEEFCQRWPVDSEFEIEIEADDERLARVYDDLFRARDFATLAWLAHPSLEGRFLEEFRRSPGGPAAHYLLEGLRRIGPSSLRLAVRTALEPETATPEKVQWAAEAARELDPAAVVPPLKRLLAHPNDRVKADAVYALAAFGPAAGLTLADVEPLTRSKDGILKRYAVGALKAVEGEDAHVSELLVRIVHEPQVLAKVEEDDFVKIWAASALLKRGRRDGVPVLVEMLRRDPDYRANAISVLTEAAGRRVGATYAEWKRWWEREGQ